MARETIRCIIQGTYLMPQDIAHIQAATDDGPLWIETDHEMANALRCGDHVIFSGEPRIERTITFLLNVRMEGAW